MNVYIFKMKWVKVYQPFPTYYSLCHCYSHFHWFSSFWPFPSLWFWNANSPQANLMSNQMTHCWSNISRSHRASCQWVLLRARFQCLTKPQWRVACTKRCWQGRPSGWSLTKDCSSSWRQAFDLRCSLGMIWGSGISSSLTLAAFSWCASTGSSLSHLWTWFRAQIPMRCCRITLPQGALSGVCYVAYGRWGSGIGGSCFLCPTIVRCNLCRMSGCIARVLRGFLEQPSILSISIVRYSSLMMLPLFYYKK